MHQPYGRSSRISYLWIACLSSLALLATYALQSLTGCLGPVGAGSSPAPRFSPPGGYYPQDIQLRITAPTRNDGQRGTVIFTLDGSVPNHTNGVTYTRPIRLDAKAQTTAVIRARTLFADGALSSTVSASYFVGTPASLPIMSLIVEPDDLWSPQHGIYANPRQRGEDWERPVEIVYLDQDRRSGFQISAGLRIHGGGSRDYAKKSFRLYFRQEYGAARLTYPLFPDSGNACSGPCLFKRLVLHSGGQDCPAPLPGIKGNWTLIRNQLTDRLAMASGSYATQSRPALLFINGESWGIYQIRERPDRYYLQDRLGIQAADFINAPELDPGESILMGDSEHWDRLLHFVESHDLADPVNYAYVQNHVNIPNLIDYTILQIYIANTDWPHHNVRQFRARIPGGRWQWLFWDSDSGFAAYPMPPHSRVNTDMVRHILTYNHFRTGGRDLLLLRQLLKNPTFVVQFLSRLADLLNTTLSPQAVTAHIDALAAELEADIAYETTRWPGGTNWASNIQELREFSSQRPDFVRQHVIQAFGLSGTTQLTINPPPDRSGYVAINGHLGQELPWTGTYFQDLAVQIAAAPRPGYRFAGWDPPDLPQTEVIAVSLGAGLTITPRFEPIDLSDPKPGDIIITGYHSGQAGWLEMLVMRPGGLDLRGWRVTDNDTKTAADEGSLIFASNPSFARVPRGTTIRIVTARTADRPPDDLNAWDRRLVLYTDNSNLDTTRDPGFNLAEIESVVLLAPGRTTAFDDDQGIAYLTKDPGFTPLSFGILGDGVLPNGVSPVTD